MRALRCNEIGGVDQLEVEEIEDPEATEGEVVVDVEVAAVQYADALIVNGAYQIPATPPFTPGSDFAGTVRATGARVYGSVFGGAFAERVKVLESALRPIPEGMSFTTAAASLTAHRTSYDAVVTVGELAPTDNLVVLGAAGGVGTAAVQIGKALGARVIACASSDEKLAFCRKAGADVAVDYVADNFKDRLKAACPGGAQVIIDPVGGPYSERALRAIAQGGRFVVVGFASGEIPRLPLNLILLKGAIVKGYDILQFTRAHPDVAAANQAALERLLASGALDPIVSARYPLADAKAAMSDALHRRALGKVVIDVRSQTIRAQA